MAFHESAPSRVWKFGCRPPRENVDLIERQFSLAHRYCNNLIELERRRRQEVEAAIQEHSLTLLSLTQSIETLIAELRELRDRITERNVAASKRTGNDADRARIADLEKRLRAARAAAKEERQRLWGKRNRETGKPRRKRGEPIRLDHIGGDRVFLDRIEAIDNATLHRMQALRGGCNVFWGTYLLIEKAVEQSVKDSLPDLPAFRRWTGNGQIGVQLQGGLSVADAFAGTDSRLRIVMQDGHCSARGQNGEVWLRIGSEGRKPIWGRFAFRLHRPLPAHAVIKWATITRRRVGTFSRYWLNLTFANPDGFDHEDIASSGRVVVNTGWRLLPDGSLRVATWVGDDGQQGFLTIPAGAERMSPHGKRQASSVVKGVAAWTKANELRGTRDKLFDEIRGKLSAWLVENESLAPDWLKDACSRLYQWRSQGRLAVLIGVGEPRPPREGGEPRPRWRENRFAGDEEIFTLLDGWLKQDTHLWNWEDNQRRKTVAWRDKLYERFAVDLRRRYRELRIANVDQRKLAKRAMPEDEDESARLARFHRTVASPGRIAECLSDSMGEVLKIDPRYLTQRCHGCGSEEPWDAGAEIEHRCAQCGIVFDQDVNHCLNLLSWEPPASGEALGETPGGARGPEATIKQEVGTSP